MLLPDSMDLRIAVPYNSRSTAWASFDGRGRVELRRESIQAWTVEESLSSLIPFLLAVL